MYRIHHGRHKRTRQERRAGYGRRAQRRTAGQPWRGLLGQKYERGAGNGAVLEKAAQIYCIAHSFGTPFPLNEKTAEALHDFYLNHYSKRQRGEE